MSVSFATLWTAAHQAPLSMGLARQEYWSGLPFPSPENLPNSRIKPASPALAGRFFTAEPPGSPIQNIIDEKVKLHSFVGGFVFGRAFCEILVPRSRIPAPCIGCEESYPLDRRGSPGNCMYRVCLSQSSKPRCLYDPVPVTALEEAQGGSRVQEGR